MNVKALTERALGETAPKSKPSTRDAAAVDPTGLAALLEYNMKTADDLRGKYDRLASEAAQKETMIQKMNDEYGVIMAQVERAQSEMVGETHKRVTSLKSKIRRREKEAIDEETYTYVMQLLVNRALFPIRKLRTEATKNR